MATEVRLLSYNVRSLRDDQHAVAAVIRECRPDLVCVQEAPRFLRWRSKCAGLARESGLLVVTGGRPAAAMLLLASLRVRVLEAKDLKLSKRLGLHQRGLALATVEVAGARFAVASIHLDLDAAERLRHATEILDVLAGCEVPTIVAGDMNEESRAPAWRAFSDRYQDGYAVAPAGGEFTSTAKRPRRRIDAVFVDRKMDVVECGVPDVPGIERASDHRPVLAVLRAG